MRSYWVQYDIVFISNDSSGERPRVISQHIEKQLLAYLEERPMLYLDELIYMLFNEFNLVVDKSIVQRVLYRLN